MNLSKLTLENLKEVRGDLNLEDMRKEIERRAELFPELVKALEDIYQRRQKCGMPVTVEPWVSMQQLLARANEIKI